MKISNVSSCSTVFPLASLSHLHKCVLNRQIIKTTTETGSWKWLMLNLQPAVCSWAQTGFVTFHCRRPGLPFVLRQLIVLEIDALLLPRSRKFTMGVLLCYLIELMSWISQQSVVLLRNLPQTSAHSVMDGRAERRLCTEASAACGRAQWQMGLLTSAERPYREDVCCGFAGSAPSPSLTAAAEDLISLNPVLPHGSFKS